MKESRKKTKTKSPGTAALLSIMVWPGSGNIHNEKFRHGAIWISSAVAAWMLYAVRLGVFVTVLISIYILAALHAYKQARKINVFRTGSPEYVPEKPARAVEGEPVHHISQERGEYAQDEH